MWIIFVLSISYNIASVLCFDFSATNMWDLSSLTKDHTHTTP